MAMLEQRPAHLQAPPEMSPAFFSSRSSCFGRLLALFSAPGLEDLPIELPITNPRRGQAWLGGHGSQVNL